MVRTGNQCAGVKRENSTSVPAPKKYAKMFNLLRTIGGYKIMHHTWFIQCGFLVILYLFLVESVVNILLVSYIMYMYIMSNCILVLP